MSDMRVGRTLRRKAQHLIGSATDSRWVRCRADSRRSAVVINSQPHQVDLWGGCRVSPHVNGRERSFQIRYCRYPLTVLTRRRGCVVTSKPICKASVLTYSDARRVLDPTARHVPHISEWIPTRILVNLVFNYVDRPIRERLAVDGGCKTIDHVHSS